MSHVLVGETPAHSSRPPFWLIVCTGVLALTILALAVAETDLKAHYLIDQGEFISVFGLIFIAVASVFLYRSRRLYASLPLVLPWLLYPIITQGDQIIDNLSINPMRAICHVLLAAIFATPVAVVVLGVRSLAAPRGGQSTSIGSWASWIPGLRPISEGRIREGSALLASALLVAETWLADQFLGTLMIVTIIAMTLAVLVYGSRPARVRDRQDERARTERLALAVALIGVVISGGAYAAYKNQPGAYQGSPSFFMDPSQKDSNYRLDRIAVPARPAAAPQNAAEVGAALTAYGQTLEKLLAGYHILDRNYTYAFHNELFVRHTPLVPNFRVVGLGLVADARQLRIGADGAGATARARLSDDDPLAALLDDLRGFVAFNFDRAPVLERLSGQFEKTPAGLQHAAHLYEGESKYLGTAVAALARKYQAVLEAPPLAATTHDFVAMSRSIYEAYAHHVVGF
jgi:hypothetical protein